MDAEDNLERACCIRRYHIYNEICEAAVEVLFLAFYCNNFVAVIFSCTQFSLLT